MNNASPSSLPHPIVALVTDRNLAGGPDALVDAVARAVDNGVNLVQMREKDLPDAVQLALAQRLREVTNGKALLFVNDSVSIAEASGADGVQLTENSRSIASARARAARPLLIGRSVHGVDAAREAAAQGADLLVVGTVYDSPTHPGQPPAGVGLVGWCAQSGVPGRRHRRHHRGERGRGHAGRARPASPSSAPSSAPPTPPAPQPDSSPPSATPSPLRSLVIPASLVIEGRGWESSVTARSRGEGGDAVRILRRQEPRLV